MTEPIRVLIVDDHRLFADGLTFAIGRQPDQVVVGIAVSVREAIGLATSAEPTVVVADYHLPDGSLSELAAAIRARVPGVAILVVTGDTGDRALLDAVEAGACGFILKSQAAETLIDAIRRAAAGEMLLSAAVLARLIGRQRERTIHDSERNQMLSRLTPASATFSTLWPRGSTPGASPNVWSLATQPFADTCKGSSRS